MDLEIAHYYALGLAIQLAGEYVSDNELEVREAQELARAIKDHERRPEGREVCYFPYSWSY